MDYSAAIADDPAAASPWGSSSPRAQRTPFAGSVPDSPTTPSRHNTGEGRQDLPGPALGTPEPSKNGGLFSEQPVPEVQGPDTQQVQSQHSAQHNHQQQSQQPVQQEQQQQPKPGAVRYHNSRPQRQVPAYKLQAKVTALERTGRKDPVLRFDVYVCAMQSNLYLC